MARLPQANHRTVAGKSGPQGAPTGSIGRAFDPAARAWSVVVTGNLTRLALGFVASVLIARDLGPVSYGVFAVLGAVASLGGAIADLGLTDAAVKRIASLWPADPTGACERSQVFFWLRLSVLAPVVLIAILVTGLIGRSLPLPSDLGLLLPLTMLGIAGTALSSTMSALLQATGSFGRFSIVMLTNALLTMLLAVALHLTGDLTILTALLILGVATSLVGFAIGYRLLPTAIRLGLPTSRVWRGEAHRLLRFGRWLWLSNMLAMLTTQLDLFLVTHWSAPAAVGAYALAVSLASKANVVNHSLYTVLLPSAAALRGRGALRHYLRQGLIRSSLISLALLLLFPLSGLIIAFFYGPAYAAALRLLRLLLGVVIFDLYVTPLLLLPYHYDRPDFLAAADALRIVVVAFLGIWLIPAIGPTGAVAARLGAGVAGAGLTVALLARRRGGDGGSLSLPPALPVPGRSSAPG